MVHGKNRISYWIDRRLTGLAGPDDDATISFGLPFEPEDSQYGKSRFMRWSNKPNNSGRRRAVFPRKVKNGLLRVQKGRCAYCGQTHRSHYLVIDHKHPVSRGGGDEIDNLQLLCNSCNMRKGIQSDEEFRYRYQRLLPADGCIPSHPIPQDSFSEETQRTRAPREVRAIFHERFTAARERQGASSAGQGSSCGLLAATLVLLLFALVLLALTL